jgi:hypothetical protein
VANRSLKKQLLWRCQQQVIRLNKVFGGNTDISMNCSSWLEAPEFQAYAANAAHVKCSERCTTPEGAADALILANQKVDKNDGVQEEV